VKEFKNALKYTFLLQVVNWGIFILFNEIIFVDHEDLTLIIGGFSLLVSLIIYFRYSGKNVEKNKYNSKLFNGLLMILWIVFSISGMIIVDILIQNGLISQCSGWGCFLNGLEYFLFGIGMQLQVVIVIVWKFLYKIYKFFRGGI